MREEDRLLQNLARFYMSNQDEMVHTAKYINILSLKGLSELRRMHTEMPSDLIAHEQLLKDLISATSVYLAQTNNWYEKYYRENLNE
jgi:hypothetical protein